MYCASMATDDDEMRSCRLPMGGNPFELGKSKARIIKDGDTKADLKTSLRDGRPREEPVRPRGSGDKARKGSMIRTPLRGSRGGGGSPQNYYREGGS